MMNQNSRLIHSLRSDLTYGVCNAKVDTYPYPHIYVESIFSEQSYTLLEENWPLQEEMQCMSDSGWVTSGSFKERFYLDVSNEEMMSNLSEKRRSVWKDFATALSSESILRRLTTICQPYHHLHPWISGEENFNNLWSDILINSDYTDYTITPHTQHPQELLVLLIYFAQKENTEDAGTSMYVPNDPNFECDGGPHHNLENFQKVSTAPFRRNSLFGFLKTRNSFHGVEALDQLTERNTLYFGIGLKNYEGSK